MLGPTPCLHCDIVLYDEALDGWHRTPLAVRGQRNRIKQEVVFTNYDPGAFGLFIGGETEART